ncbi:hsp70 family protein [Sphingopyxis bauzanensis]|uniref:Hsp70 family protein n=1 Tax=Sphingopyxis bauzanensis TaxID=651663 RepID=A0A246JSH8_9SPHN|nr:Hsp70 family protein [Sphingopyxis bauzanensis]MDP3781546.1 Hsp70 family protein [Sphingopyxis sp.]OWQ95893.1 hsp70 family protein [Sphingopyxis bauzanensis]GGJ49791.1 molecular chaperone Hsp70 [Sphingopyxis bauzanensis]
MTSHATASALGLDFGTTNTVVALTDGQGGSQLVEYAGDDATGAVFRSALCFWEEERAWQGIAHEAGPWAITEYLQSPLDSRFVQSFKSVAASASFERALIFNKPYRFEDMGRLFLQRLVAHAGGRLDTLPQRVIVGRPVEYAGARPDPVLARQRYDAMLAAFGTEIIYVHEPLGAAHSYSARLTEPATILVADFGGGTTDFSIVRVAAPGAPRRCVPLASSGIGIAGDRFDYRIIDRLVLPLLGKGGLYRSFDKLLEIPGGHFRDFADWSRLALMRNRRTMAELARLQRDAVDPEPIGRMIALIEHEQGFPLYDAVGKLKRALSSESQAEFRFSGEGVDIAATVRRADFETWIADDLRRIEAAMDAAMARAGAAPESIDRVFLTGGSSLIPAIGAMFERRFGAERIATGGELTSIAHGLALIGAEDDPGEWAA